MLTVRNLQKTYPTGVEAIQNVSFEVRPGEFICIVGPSGAGKTTLLRCLCGLLGRSSGVIKLDDELVVTPPAKMAAVFQDYSRSLMPWYSIERNVMLPLKNKIPDKEARRAQVAKALNAVGLAGFESSYPWQLSGGMQQRVAIARAIVYEPEILVMDEPFASVDAQTRSDLEDLVLKIHESMGTAVLLVTHDIDEAVYMADRVVVLSSRPSRVLEIVDIDLPRGRDQVETKSSPLFAEYRAHVLKLVRGHRPAEPPAQDVTAEQPAVALSLTD